MINKKPLIKFLIWVSILFVLVFVGINNIFALETKTIYSVNNNGTLASSNTYNYGYLTGGGTQATARANVNTTISGKSYGFMFLYYETVSLNKTYTMVINFMDIDLLKTFNSSMVRVATCNGDTCNDNTIISVVKNNNSGNSNKLTIQFNPITTGSVILVNLGGNNEPITGVSTFGIKSITLDSSNPNQDIIDNNTQNSNNIINNNNSNTQEIIDNQNQNTQDIIDSQYTCKIRSITLNNYKDITNSYLSSNGSLVSSNASNYYSVTSYIKIQQNQPYIINLRRPNINSPAFCLYDNNKELISCTSFSTSTEISFNSGNATYFRSTLRDISTGISEIYLNGNICLKDSQEQKNAINDLNDSINNDSVDDNGVADAFESFNDFLDDNSTITQLITLPITLYTAILNNVNGTCQPFNLGKLYGEDLILPCINISQYLGSSLWTMIDIIISGFAVYAISKKMIKVFNNFSSLREGDVIDD